jgi:predicted metalloenzyme YecM
MSAQIQLQVPEATVQYLELPFPEAREVPIRGYYKSELATLYGISLPTLKKYIDRWLAEFEDIGYSKNQQKLTPKMVRLLFERVGEP